MKRRLPTSRKGEVVLAAISLPPLTEHANRHTPSASHPGRPAAAPNAAPIAASANRPASAAGLTASPPSSTASAANPVPSSRARRRNRRTQPRAVVYGTARRAAAGRTPHQPPATPAITAPTVSATSSRQASTNAGSSAWLTRHGAHRSRGRRSSGSGPPPGHDASNPTTTPAARHTTGTPGGGTSPPARPPRRHRPAAGTAIPWPRATPPWIPPRDRGQTTAGRDPSRSKGDAQDPGPDGHRQAATSPKSTAEDPARMLRKSGRQHQPAERDARAR